VVLGQTLHEQEAILQLKAGNICGLEVLYRDHYEAVFRTAYGIVRNHHVAEDVTQRVFIELFSAIKRFDLKRPFSPWLHRTAVRRSLDELRRRPGRDVPIDEALAHPSADPSPEEEAIQSELKAIVWKALAALDPKHRAAVVLRCYQDFSEAEMAVALRCRRGTVRSRLHYARARLRELLAENTLPLAGPGPANPMPEPPLAPTGPGPANPKFSRNGKEKSTELSEEEPVADSGGQGPFAPTQIPS